MNVGLFTRKFRWGCLCASLLVLIPAGAAFAQEHHHHFHGGDVRHFDRHELGLWRGGVWRHDYFHGRLGWWWIVDGIRYFYAAPIYPYPLVVSGLAYPQPVIVQPPPVMVQPQMWYYCDNPPGYYPNVATCMTPFRAVPARPQ